jgi:hypothetical protein
MKMILKTRSSSKLGGNVHVQGHIICSFWVTKCVQVAFFLPYSRLDKVLHHLWPLLFCNQLSTLC